MGDVPGMGRNGRAKRGRRGNLEFWSGFLTCKNCFMSGMICYDFIDTTSEALG